MNLRTVSFLGVMISKTAVLSAFLLLSLFLTVVQGATIVGVVTDGVTNEPVTGATASLLVPPNDIEVERTYTALNGTFTFDDIAARNYIIQIEASGYFVLSSDEITVAEDDELLLFFDLEPLETRLRGTVYDSRTHETVPDAVVILRNYFTGEMLRAMPTTENGNYIFAPLEAGSYNIEICKETYDPLRILNFRLYENEDRVLSINLVPMETSISGTIRNLLNNQLVREAVVSLRNANNGVEVRSLTTGYSGSFHFGYLDVGTYDISVTAFGYNPTIVENIQLELFEKEVVNIILAPIDTRVSGIVMDSQTSEPIANARIKLIEPVYHNVMRTTYSNETGFYEFIYMDVGQYDIEIFAIGYYPETLRQIRLALFDDITENVELDATPHPTIQTIQTGLTGGEWVSTRGIVTLPTNCLNTNLMIAYIQDESGYGVMIYNGGLQLDQETDGLNRGDEIFVTGQFSETGYQGVSRLLNAEFIRLSTGNEIFPPLQATTGEMATYRRYEGAYVEVTGILLTNPGAGSYDLRIDDGTGYILARIYETAHLDLSAFHINDRLTMRGVLGVNQGFLQIIPALQEDIILLSDVEEPFFLNLPVDYEISEVYPNPFNAEVQVIVAVPQRSEVRIEVFDILGRSVAMLHQGELPAGYHSLQWTANAPSGIYLLYSSAPGWQDTRKLVLVK